MRVVVIGVLATVACSIAILVKYPWSTYYGNFHFRSWPTFVSYVAVAAVVGLLAAVVTWILFHRPIELLLLQTVKCGFSMFAVIAILSHLFGTDAGLDVPGTQIRGVFFAEWNFLNFIFCVGAPTSVFTALMFAWAGRRQPRMR